MKIEYPSYIFVAGIAFLLGISSTMFVVSHEQTKNTNLVEQQTLITERNRVYLVERGAEDDAGELALSQHQEVN